MLGDRKIIFDAVKLLRGGRGYVQSEVELLDTAIDRFAEGTALARVGAPAPVLSPPPLELDTPKPALTKGKFVLSEESLKKLGPVKVQLRNCVELAITLSMVDFRVQQGLRTIEEQRAAVAAGNSRTMKSKHLRQSDNSVWAVDLVALIGGKVSWNVDLYGAIAYAMDQAATQLQIANHIRWGCAWDRVLSDFGGSPNAYLAEAQAYAKRHAGSDLMDGPHFEWVS